MAIQRNRPPEHRTALLLDFDGTLTERDVGGLLLDAFAPPQWRQEEAAWRAGDITFKVMNEREFAYLPAGRRAEMERYVLEQARPRPGGSELVCFCLERDIPLEIVSGGLDFYIRPLLERFGMGHLQIHAMKHAKFSQSETIVPTYPEGVTVCDTTGACKCSRLWHYQEKGYRVVFVGDGNSDRCVASRADTVYARDNLARYCREQSIPFTPYETLHDVLAGVKEIVWE